METFMQGGINLLRKVVSVLDKPNPSRGQLSSSQYSQRSNTPPPSPQTLYIKEQFLT